MKGGLQKGFKGASRELEKGLKGASRRRGLQGGLLGASEGLQGASRGLQKGLFEGGLSKVRKVLGKGLKRA